MAAVESDRLSGSLLPRNKIINACDEKAKIFNFDNCDCSHIVSGAESRRQRVDAFAPFAKVPGEGALRHSRFAFRWPFPVAFGHLPGASCSSAAYLNSLASGLVRQTRVHDDAFDL